MHKGLREEIEATGLRLLLSDSAQGGSYPNDAIFNALVIGKRLFCKTDSVSSDVLRLAEREGLEVIGVKQGYPACTTLAISDRAAVTSDKGMAKALEKSGISTLLIPESEKIKLPPYKNGFIGGAAGKFGDKIFFLGNVNALPYCDALLALMTDEGVSALSLDEESDSLLDLGGIILHKKLP